MKYPHRGMFQRRAQNGHTKRRAAENCTVWDGDPRAAFLRLLPWAIIVPSRWGFAKCRMQTLANSDQILLDCEAKMGIILQSA